jgi:hypothetical protein
MEVVIVLVALYLLPTIVAFARGRHNTGAIIVLNLFLGWTLLGWVVALVWAVSSSQPPVTPMIASAPPRAGTSPGNHLGDAKKCPFCAEIIKSEAKVCRFCGRDVPEGPSLDERFETWLKAQRSSTAPPPTPAERAKFRQMFDFKRQLGEL